MQNNKITFGVYMMYLCIQCKQVWDANLENSETQNKKLKWIASLLLWKKTQTFII